jgi:hypothetical protein
MFRVIYPEPPLTRERKGADRRKDLTGKMDGKKE